MELYLRNEIFKNQHFLTVGAVFTYIISYLLPYKRQSNPINLFYRLYNVQLFKKLALYLQGK